MQKVATLKRLAIVVFALTMIFSGVAKAQLSDGGKPVSLLTALSTAPQAVQMPAIDLPTLRDEDRANEGKGVPFRFGFPHPVSLSVKQDGKLDILPNGDKVWRLRVTAPGASSLNFVYSHYELPHGAKMFLYNSDQTKILGAFTYRNNNAEDHMFGTGLISSDDVTIELYEPANVEFASKVVLSHVVQGYRDVFKDYPLWQDYGTSGSCNNNVACAEGDPWRNEIRGVAMILTDINSRLCSGSMINNTAQDLKPYFLTANHCVAAGTPTTWLFMFKYQSPTCSPQSDGPTVYTLSGSTVKAKNADSDFALLLLNTAPPDSFQVHFAGWNRVDAPDTKSVCIHHPDGDVKKISFDNDPCTSSDYEPAAYLANSHWKITNWDDGTTEGGSSGSPLFDQNHLIIGQLHGGWASCTSATADFFGKFAMSWDRGTSSATRLKDWLDPLNSGVTTLAGWDPTMVPPDTIPPTKITNLAVSGKTTNSITIGWSAPMDTSAGGIKGYDIRYATSNITDTTSFAAATQVPYTGTFGAAGTAQSQVVNGLAVRTKYFFAVRSKDVWGNKSLISNIASDTTLFSPTMLVTPDSIKRLGLGPNQIVLDSILIKNNSSQPSTLSYSVELLNNSFPSGLVDLKIEPVNGTLIGKTERAKGEADNYSINVGQSVLGSGGPDGGGYKWIDSDAPNGPAYEWNDISTTGTQVTGWTATGTGTAADDGISPALPLGFDFKFYGVVKNSVYCTTNGLVVFTPFSGNNGYSNTTIPTAAIPNDYIAPFWDDMDGRTQGTVHYKAEANRFIIQYTNWQKYGATSSLTFQVVLYKGGKIMIYYNTMTATLTSATVGIENAAGTIGTQIAYNAAYVKNNLAVKLSAEPDWIQATNLSGILAQGNTAAVRLTMRTEDFPVGMYSMDVKITSNDSDHLTKVVPVRVIIGDTPVELTSFVGESKGSDVVLKWATATETNNNQFKVERKTSTTDWTVVGTVKGNGTTTQKSSYSFTDSKVASGKVSYRLKQYDFDGTMSTSKSIEVNVEIPKEFELTQNYPNPFNPTTVIAYSIPEKAAVQLDVYNTLGQKVATLVSKQQDAGSYKLEFDASHLSSGTYIYTVKAVGESKVYSSTKKMLLIK